MKILLLVPNFYPEKTGIGVSATDCARHLVSLGHDLTVVTSVPYYPEWKVPEKYKGKCFFEELVENIKVIRLWRYVPKVPSTIKRIAHELTFAIHAALRALFSKQELIVCISPPLLLSFFALIVGRLKKTPVWVYVQDIQPDTAIALGMIRNKYFISLLKWMEDYIYRHAKKILVLSSVMKDNILKKQSSNTNVSVVPLSIDVNELKSNISKESNKYRKLFPEPGTFLVVYCGNLGEKHGADIIADCANALEKDIGISFLIAGDGAKRYVLEAKIQKFGLKNVTLLPLVDRQDLPELLASADVLLSLQRKEVIDIAIPSKLLTYLAAGKPVIASAPEDSTTAHLLIPEGAGVVVPPESVKELTNALIELKINPSFAQALAERGYQLAHSKYSHEGVRKEFYLPLFKES